MFTRKNAAMFLAEFFGVALLTLAVYSMMARTSFPLFSGLAAGGVAGLMVLVVGQFSSAHINPAVTVGMWSLRKISTLNAAIYLVAQFLGAFAAWALLKYFIGHSLTSMAGAKFDWKIFVAEMVGAGIFVFGVASATLQKFEKAKLAGVVGISLALGMIVASLASNGLVNPVLALGIQSWDWAYALGPVAGAIIGANLYAIVSGAGGTLSISLPVKISSKKKKSSRRKR